MQRDYMGDLADGQSKSLKRCLDSKRHDARFFERWPTFC